MEQALFVSNLVLWAVVIALAVTVIALTRQIGILYERVAPAGALMMGQGPKVGELAPSFELEDLRGKRLRIGGASPVGRSTLVFFLSPTCPVCNTLIPVLRSLRRDEGAWLDIVLASDGDEERQRQFVADKDLGEFAYVLSTQLGMGFQVSKLPYAVLIDEHGVMRARGLTNSREHLESLFEAKERGVASIQEYLSQRNGHQGAA
ncbi:MAG: methylamine dehydrogenase accessory protein MauD [Gammaproteobacteria bacterium]|nr:methylamine dehydrogenase accessory protein MauD [Gammaproteobacteria bacterium]